VAEAAKMARLSKYKIYSLIKENKIYYIKLQSKQYLIPTASFQQWINSGGNATRFDQIIAIVNSECGGWRIILFTFPKLVFPKAVRIGKLLPAHPAELRVGPEN